MGRIVETVWDCAYCGKKGIRGRLTDCPSCGKARNADTKFYLPKKITYLNETIDDVSNPDWYCSYCDSYNPASEDTCLNCGSPKSGAKNYFEMLQEKGKTPNLHDPNDASSKDNKGNRNNKNRKKKCEPLPNIKQARRKRNRIAILTVLIIAFCTAVTLFVIKNPGFEIPKISKITVENLSWEREIDIQEYRLIEEGDWTVPDDAIEQTRTANEIHHYDQVFDHYEKVQVQKSRRVQDGYDIHYSYRDLGNGRAEEVEHRTPRYRIEYYYVTENQPVYKSVPVYQTKYYYMAWRYVHDHTEKAYGKLADKKSTEPYWPEVNLKENQREGERTEKYNLGFVYKGNPNSHRDCSISSDIASKLKVGKTYRVLMQGNTIKKVY